MKRNVGKPPKPQFTDLATVGSRSICDNIFRYKIKETPTVRRSSPYQYEQE